jgi:DnaK suppressor protein
MAAACQETFEVKSAAAKSPTQPAVKPVGKTPANSNIAKVRAIKDAVSSTPTPTKAPAHARPRAAKSAAAPSVVTPPAPLKTKVLTMPAAAPVPVPVKKNPRLAGNWKIKPVQELTDAEVIAMPDSEYMNDTQMAFFRLKLVRLKDDILTNAGQTAENLRDDTIVVPDPADRATIEEEHALELRTRDRERKLLKKIEQSIARIDSGDYGYCDETGESIGVGRLLARPTATLSLEAQQRRELKQKMFGD